MLETILCSGQFCFPHSSPDHMGLVWSGTGTCCWADSGMVPSHRSWLQLGGFHIRVFPPFLMFASEVMCETVLAHTHLDTVRWAFPVRE